MKPNFALKLSNDGVELLHRAAAGWSPVGTVSFENDDIAGACAALVKTAEGLDPAGLRSKLVLPESELRYVTVVAPGPTDEARRYQIEAEIERLTPYGIDELAYDWSVEEDHALVVICARETLIEAETFAEGYGFNPVSFVAHPEAGKFVGEPFFGETMVAPTLLKAGDHVQPDAEAMRIVAARRVEPAKAEPAKAEAPKAEAPKVDSAKPVVSRPAPEPAMASTAEARPATPAPAGPAGAVPPAPARPPMPRVAPMNPASAAPPISPRTPPSRAIPTGFPPASAPEDSKSRVGSLVRRMGTRLRREQADAAKADAPAAPKAPLPPAAAQAPATHPVVAPVAPRPAPGTDAAPPVARPAPDAADAKPEGEAVAFSSRRRPTPVADAPAPAPSAAAPANPGGRIAVLPPGRTEPQTGAAQRFMDRARAGAKTAFAGASAAAQNARTKAATLRREAEPATVSPASASPAAPPAAAPESPGAAPTPGKLRPRRAAAAAEAIVPTSRPPANERDKEREAEAMTIFGARGMQRNDSNLARRGLMAAGGALLLLIAVAVWAIYFNGSDRTQLAGGSNVTTAPVPTGALPGIEAPAGLATATPDTAETPAALPAPPAEPTATEPAATDTAVDTPAPAETDTATAAAPDPDQMLETLVQEALNEALPTETLPPETLPAETLPAEAPVQTATAEPPAEAPALAEAPRTDAPQTDSAAPAQGTEVATSDSPQVTPTETAATRLSLPSGFEVPAGSEVGFAVPPPPPPFGTEFTFDDRGLVEATPEGALTPSGVTVFARRPDAVPAPRPASIAPPPEPAAPEVAQPAAPQPETLTEPVAAAIENAIAEAVGEAAPAAPEAAPEAPPEAPVVGDDTPRADPALAGARPLPRPESVRAIGERLERERQAADGDQTQLVVPAETAIAAATPAVADPAVLASAASTALPESDAATRGSDGGTVTELAALEAPTPGGVTLASLRPQRRPTDLVPPPEPTPELDLSGATPEAVAASPMPGARPDDLAERARAILAAAAAARPAAPAASAGTDAEDQAGEAAATASAAPAIPSSASVSRQATEENAIRLNQINLIGVFGTPNDRRALVRLSSGRVVRVQVGDRLDGGQVAAIGDSEIRYVKNGRNEVLRIGG